MGISSSKAPAAKIAPPAKEVASPGHVLLTADDDSIIRPLPPVPLGELSNKEIVMVRYFYAIRTDDDLAFSKGGRMEVIGDRQNIMAETQKLERFTSGQMGDKPVTCIPGIGQVHGQRLKERGLHYASQVFGMFLQLNEDEDDFKEWLSDKVRVIDGEAQDRCFNALLDWHQTYFV